MDSKDPSPKLLYAYEISALLREYGTLKKYNKLKAEPALDALFSRFEMVNLVWHDDNLRFVDTVLNQQQSLQSDAQAREFAPEVDATFHRLLDLLKQQKQFAKGSDDYLALQPEIDAVRQRNEALEKRVDHWSATQQALRQEFEEFMRKNPHRTMFSDRELKWQRFYRKCITVLAALAVTFFIDTETGFIEKYSHQEKIWFHMLLILFFFVMERLVFDPALELFIKWNDVQYFRFRIRFLEKVLGRLEPERLAYVREKLPDLDKPGS